MDRTVIDLAGNDWLVSEAYPDENGSGDGPFVPLDDQMGTGHLNVARALEQYSPGQHAAGGADVPVKGWDYGTTTDNGNNDREVYRFDTPLQAGGFVSITLAWDREVVFQTNGGAQDKFDPGDMFLDYTPGLGPPDDSVINDLNLWLLPRNSGNVNQALAVSSANFGTVEHLFFQIPTTGEYEIWVTQDDADVGTTQNYGIAWWGWDGSVAPVTGDYDGNGTIGPEDYVAWRGSFGSTVTPGTGADGNNDGVIDAADYTVWRDNLPTMAATSGPITAAPEPSAIWLVVLATFFVSKRRG